MYERCGTAIWKGDDSDARGDDREEVAALAAVVSVWMWWDLRFVVLDETARDRRPIRRETDVARRATAMRGLAAALELSLDDQDDGDDSPLEREGALSDEFLLSLPAGADRIPCRGGVPRGCERVPDDGQEGAAARPALGPAGVGPAPAVALARSARRSRGKPSQLGGLAPNLQRMAALLDALGV